MIHNPKMECMSRDEMTALQSERLRQQVKRCYEKVPFYKQKMDRMGLKPEDIRGVEDIYKLPFTGLLSRIRKDDLKRRHFR